MFQNSVPRGRNSTRKSQTNITASNRGCRTWGSYGHEPKERRTEAWKWEVGETAPISSKWIVIYIFVKENYKWSVENIRFSALFFLLFYWFKLAKLDCVFEAAWRFYILCSARASKEYGGSQRSYFRSSTRHRVSLSIHKPFIYKSKIQNIFEF